MYKVLISAYRNDGYTVIVDSNDERYAEEIALEFVVERFEENDATWVGTAPATEADTEGLSAWEYFGEPLWIDN